VHVFCDFGEISYGYFPKPERLWGPPGLLFTGYRFFPQGVNVTDLQVVPG